MPDFLIDPLKHKLLSSLIKVFENIMGTLRTRYRWKSD